jgi:hypothetical protein
MKDPTISGEERFTDAAVARMYRWMAVLAIGGTVFLLVWRGWWYAGGFAAGAALSILNFHWLKQAVDALAGYFEPPGGRPGATPPGAAPDPAEPAAAPLGEQGEQREQDEAASAGAPPADVAADTGRFRPQGSGALLAKFVLRYAFIGIAAYVILRSSALSLSAFLAGIFVFVAGVLAEMIYELVTGTGS